VSRRDYTIEADDGTTLARVANGNRQADPEIDRNHPLRVSRSFATVSGLATEPAGKRDPMTEAIKPSECRSTAPYYEGPLKPRDIDASEATAAIEILRVFAEDTGAFRCNGSQARTLAAACQVALRALGGAS